MVVCSCVSEMRCGIRQLSMFKSFIMANICGFVRSIHVYPETNNAI